LIRCHAAFLVVLLLCAWSLAQERYSNTGLGQMQASERISAPKNYPVAQHTLGETASHFAAAEPSVLDKKRKCLNGEKKYKNCADVLQNGNGTVRFEHGGLVNSDSSGTELYPFFTEYKFNEGLLIAITINTDNSYSQVVDDFSARYGNPSKSWTETSQNAMGAQFHLDNSAWDLPEGARALVKDDITFIVPPGWASKVQKEKGYVHVTKAVILSASEVSKLPNLIKHENF
jgi:hypothetical protein